MIFCKKKVLFFVLFIIKGQKKQQLTQSCLKKIKRYDKIYQREGAMAGYEKNTQTLNEVNERKRKRASNQREANIKYLVEQVGFSEELAKKMVDKENLAPLSNEELASRMEFFRGLGMTNSEIVKMSKKFSKIFSYTVPHMQEVCENLKNGLGADEKQIFDTVTSFPRIFSYSLKNIQEKKKFVKENLCPAGVSSKELIAKNLQILCRSEKDLLDRKTFLKETFGLNENECRDVIFNNTYIFGMAKDSLSKKADAIEQVFGSKKYVLNDNFILTASPEKLKFNYMILSQYSADPTSFMKKRFYLHRPGVLYARAEGLKSANRQVRTSLILQTNKYFEEKTGLNTPSLLTRFPFDKSVVQDVVSHYHEKFPKVPITLDEEEIKVIVAGGHSARAKKEVEMGEV